MTQSPTSFDPLLVTIVLGTLAIGLPIIMVLAIRFLWDRNLNVGHSKQLEKLIWQLHRMASALEHQMNLSFPAVQPGTEEPRDLAFLQQVAAQPIAGQPFATAQSVASASAAANAAVASAKPAVAQQTVAPPPLPQEISTEVPHRGGVNSMFGR